LRAFSVFWVFAGILVMQIGVVPYVHRFAGFSLALVFVAVAIAGTFFLLHKEKTTKS
jgi:hypothetical protein